MTAFFIIVSLILNIVALMAIIILFLRQNKLLQVEENQKKNINEMEELISTYLLEMKDENEHFIQRISEMNKEKMLSLKNESKDLLSSKITDFQLEEEVGENISEKQQDFTNRLEKTVGFQAVKAYKQQTKRQPGTRVSPSVSGKEQNGYDQEQDHHPAFKEEQVRKSNIIHEDSLLSEILIMKNQGLSEEEMAKKLHKGKTEIALLLKFRKNQQE